jgi:hypothetical protein
MNDIYIEASATDRNGSRFTTVAMDDGRQGIYHEASKSILFPDGSFMWKLVLPCGKTTYGLRILPASEATRQSNQLNYFRAVLGNREGD